MPIASGRAAGFACGSILNPTGGIATISPRSIKSASSGLAIAELIRDPQHADTDVVNALAGEPVRYARPRSCLGRISKIVGRLLSLVTVFICCLGGTARERRTQSRIRALPMLRR